MLLECHCLRKCFTIPQAGPKLIVYAITRMMIPSVHFAPRSFRLMIRTIRCVPSNPLTLRTMKRIRRMSKNLRPIVVDGAGFRWRFDERIVIVPDGRSGPPLYVEWGWMDPFEPDGAGGPKPSIVTPRFVAEAIRSAMSLGWSPDKEAQPWHLFFADGSFQIRQQPAD